MVPQFNPISQSKPSVAEVPTDTKDRQELREAESGRRSANRTRRRGINKLFFKEGNTPKCNGDTNCIYKRFLLDIPYRVRVTHPLRLSCRAVRNHDRDADTTKSVTETDRTADRYCTSTRKSSQSRSRNDSRTKRKS